MTEAKDTLTIGFSGHLDLGEVREDELRAALEKAFALTTEAARTARRRTSKSAGGSISEAVELRLLTGFGPGADRLAVNAWRQGGRGLVHALFPYLDPDEETAAWTDDPATALAEARVADIDTSFEAFTALDGAAGQAETPPRHAHLEITRWLMGWSQVLVAFWDGKAGGVGGTGDSVFRALRHGVPVLWVHADASVKLSIIDPSRLGSDTNARGLAATLAQSNHGGLTRPPKAAELAELLSRALATPPVDHGHSNRPAPDPVETFEKHSRAIAFDANGLVIPEEWWQRIRFGVYDTFVRMLSSGTVPKNETASSGLSRFRRFFWRNKPAVNAADRLEPLLHLFLRADAVANRLSDRHRSTQIVISVLAILAVAVAMVPALAPNWKVACVVVESVILVLGGLTFRRGKRAGNELTWSDARRLGERLRGLLVLWPLGEAVSNVRLGLPTSWSEWHVQKLLRQIGPPTGRLDHPEMLKRAEAARIWLVRGQATYHGNLGKRHERIHENMEKIEGALFYGLLFVLLIYIATYVGYLMEFWPKPSTLFGNFVLFASAVVPAIGASFIAIESRFDFHPTAHRSTEMARRFRQLNRALQNEIERKEMASLTILNQLLSESSALALSDVENWRGDLDRRSLIMQG